MIWLRQIAQLSTTMSHAHRATAFHFFTSNLFLPSPSGHDPVPLLALLATFLTAAVELEAAGASVISTSAIFAWSQERDADDRGAVGTIPGELGVDVVGEGPLCLGRSLLRVIYLQIPILPGTLTA